MRLKLCGGGSLANTVIDAVNGQPITDTVPVHVKGMATTNDCTEADARANLEELGKHMRKGVNTFEIATSGVQVELILEVEL